MSDNFSSGKLDRILLIIRGRSVATLLIGWSVISGFLALVILRFLEVSESALQQVDRAIIIAVLGALLATFIFSELRNVRNERFAIAMWRLHDFEHKIRDIHGILDLAENGPKKDIETHKVLLHERLDDCITDVAEIFSLITGRRCRAAIKFFRDGVNRDVVVYTYSRDRMTWQSLRADDDARNRSEVDTLAGNSDFDEVHGENKGRYFFSNNLSTRRNYRNSRLSQLSGSDESMFWRALQVIYPTAWELDYISGFVWPIRKPRLYEVKGSKFDMVGFLTVDCDRRWAFREKVDSQLGGVVADSLYYMLKRIISVGQREGMNVKSF